MNVEIIDRLIEQDPALESSRAALEAMKEGPLYSQKLGFGKIVGFEADKGMILVDFEGDELKSHPMDRSSVSENSRCSTMTTF